MAQVFETQLAKSQNRLKSDFRLEGAKVSNEMKTGLKDSNAVAHRKAANCVVMLQNLVAVMRKADTNHAPASNVLTDEETTIRGSATINEGREELLAA